jgi:hypothetical protein
VIEQVVRAQFIWPIPTLTVELKEVEDLNEKLAQIILDRENDVISKGKPTTVAGLAEDSLEDCGRQIPSCLARVSTITRGRQCSFL